MCLQMIRKKKTPDESSNANMNLGTSASQAEGQSSPIFGLDTVPRCAHYQFIDHHLRRESLFFSIILDQWRLRLQHLYKKGLAFKTQWNDNRKHNLYCHTDTLESSEHNV